MNILKQLFHYKQCFRYEKGCVKPQEVFADQFAYYATSYEENFTFYRTPQLLSDQEFEAGLKQKIN
jgi:hypothetical protein